MAGIDSSHTQTLKGAAAATISDGAANSLSLALEISMSWESSGRAVSEARHRGRHLATPNVIETDDNDMSITIEGHVRSYLGSSNVHEYEAMTKTGNAAAWTSTGAGNAYLFTLTVTTLEPNSTSTQTLTFPFCHLDTWSSGETDGKKTFSATLTSYANRPTIA